MYVVILAGGGGTRLWPLSTPDRPKPFLPLLGDESMLTATVRRLLDGSELALTAADITVVGDERYRELVAEHAPGVAFLPEPAARNTAPAIALATVAITRPWDDVMLVLPADHLIAREAEFRTRLAVAAAAAERRVQAAQPPLVTLGVTPDRPATEYGYLVPATGAEDEAVVPLRAFEEKPRADRAQQLLERPGTAWNAGVFAWRRGTIADALRRHAARVWRAAAIEAPAPYERLTPVSIDVALMQPSAGEGRVAMVRADVGWSDIGGWASLLAALGAPIPGAVVVPAGAGLEAGEDDLIVHRRGDWLSVEAGPGWVGDDTFPTAVLHRAAASAPVVEALVARVETAGLASSFELLGQRGGR